VRGRGGTSYNGQGGRGRGEASYIHHNQSIDTHRFSFDHAQSGRSTADVLSVGADADLDNLNQFSIKHQMYTLLNTNRYQANPNSLTAQDVKGIYVNLFNSREVIINLIPDDKRAR